MTQNPFDTPKASHFTADEILELYVDAAGDNEEVVARLLEPTSTTPLRLLGSKGSGKTHLLRYCSHSVRKRKFGGNLVKAIRNDGYIGLYIDSGALNAQKFFGKGMRREQWQSVFGYYFEMWLVHHFLTVLQQLPTDSEGSAFLNLDQFLSDVRDCFDVDVADEFDSLEGLLAFLTRLRKDVDYRSNNAALQKDIFNDLEIRFSPGRLIFGTAKAFHAACSEIGGATVCYMIDEAENFSELQQTFFNSLIRYREGRVTFRVGARLYGIHTNDTMNEGEPIKRGSEYEETSLDDFLRGLGDVEYRNFSAKLIAKRLNQAGIACSAERKSKLSQEFESIDPANDYSKECLGILKTTDQGNRERPYFKKFRSTLLTRTKIDEKSVDEIIEQLQCKERPLIEKTNLLLFYRKAPREAGAAMLTAGEIAESARAYSEGDKAKGRRHVNVLSYYKSDLLAQLYREARQPVAYCGFDTIVALSQGIPRNLLMLLKHIYRRSLFAGEQPFEGGVISKHAQTDGIKDASQWFWEDAQPETNAASVRLSIEAVARLFRTVRYSATPSEPGLSCFSVRESELTEEARKTLRTAENWSHLIHVPHAGSDKNTEERRYKYQLVPMLAPKWDVSYTIRGTIELDDDFANALFDEDHRDNLGALFKKRTDPMLEVGIFRVDPDQDVLL
ncbi:hypothetical protein FMN50_01795 [Rhodobacterales bacterium]|nr:hypothetical protein FMN50_01795 [Rhodobacterales bacterium]